MNNKSHSYASLLAIAVIILVGSAFIYYFAINKAIKPIKVGVIHSLSGDLAIVEEPIMGATLLAIDQINKNGGILNRFLEPIVLDGRSDNPTFAKQAETLIKEEKVEVIFGGFTPSSRKAIKSVVEKYNKLLFFPGFNEGLEESPNIFYTGPVANQYLIPPLIWGVNNLGKKVFLVGNESYYSKINSEIIKDTLQKISGSLAGEEYIKKHHKDFSEIVKKIEQSEPNLIINTLAWESSVTFLNDIKKIATDKNIKILTLGLTFNELSYADYSDTYIAGSYFEEINTPESYQFKKAIKGKYNATQYVNDPMEAAYSGVYFWMTAVDKINSLNTDKIKEELIKTKIVTPLGITGFADNHYVYKPAKIMKLSQPKEFVWNSATLIKPETYPISIAINQFIKNVKTKEEWDDAVERLAKYWRINEPN